MPDERITRAVFADTFGQVGAPGVAAGDWTTTYTGFATKRLGLP